MMLTWGQRSARATTKPAPQAPSRTPSRSTVGARATSRRVSHGNVQRTLTRHRNSQIGYQTQLDPVGGRAQASFVRTATLATCTDPVETSGRSW